MSLSNYLVGGEAASTTLRSHTVSLSNIEKEKKKKKKGKRKKGKGNLNFKILKNNFFYNYF